MAENRAVPSHPPARTTGISGRSAAWVGFGPGSWRPCGTWGRSRRRTPGFRLRGCQGRRGDTWPDFAAAGGTLMAKVPGHPDRPRFPKEDFHLGMETGSCSCWAGNITRTLLPAVELSLCRVPRAAPGGGAPTGVAEPIENPPGSLFRPHQDPVPTVPRIHRGQPGPVGRQSRVDGRTRLRDQRWQYPGRWRKQLRRQFRRRVARGNLDPHFAPVGCTDHILLLKKGFYPSFQARVARQPSMRCPARSR